MFSDRAVTFPVEFVGEVRDALAALEEMIAAMNPPRPVSTASSTSKNSKNPCVDTKSGDRALVNTGIFLAANGLSAFQPANKTAISSAKTSDIEQVRTRPIPAELPAYADPLRLPRVNTPSGKNNGELGVPCSLRAGYLRS
jgi:hypothetical protein